MTFKASISDVVISNEALALLPAEPITSMEEQVLEARECRRFYRPIVAEMLEEHHWDLAVKRDAPATVANDRENEWRFAYAKPSDMAYPVRALSANGSLWSGWSLQGGTFCLPGGGRLFMLAGAVLYSNIETMTLEYTSFDITEADFTFSFKKAVVAELAARICMPITKDARRAQTLASLAEGYRQRSIARDLNRNQPTYGNSMTESEMVRFGGMGQAGSSGYALDPVAFPANTGT